MYIMKTTFFFLKKTYCFKKISMKFIKITSKMPYKKHISEINVLGYLQRVAMLKILIITMLEMIMLSLLPKVPFKIESRLLVVYKKLSKRSSTCIKKRTRMFMFGVMEWGHNSYLAIYSNY